MKKSLFNYAKVAAIFGEEIPEKTEKKLVRAMMSL